METIPEEENTQNKRNYNISEGRKASYWPAHNGTWFIVSVLKYLWRVREIEKEQN